MRLFVLAPRYQSPRLPHLSRFSKGGIPLRGWMFQYGWQNTWGRPTVGAATTEAAPPFAVFEGWDSG